MSEARKPRRILRLPAVITRVGRSRSSIYSMMADGKFPRALSLGGPRAIGWDESDIDDWLAGLSQKPSSGRAEVEG
jgi:prophage regulatory protein